MNDVQQVPFSESVCAEDPVVSAIVPCFKQAHYLPESVASLVAQDYPPLEIVIVNDGSPDNTSEVARQLIAQYPTTNIRLLEKENGGVSDARNYAIARATGRILLTLDADDLVQPSFIHKGLQAMRETGANFVCTYSEVFGEERDVWQPPDYEVYSIRYENCVPTLSMFDRMFWEKSGGFKTAFPFNEDWEFWINCSRHDIVPYRLRGNFHLYRSTSTGLAHNYIKETWPISVATMMTANQDLYPASQVLWAHTQLAGIPDHWAEKFAEYSKMHDDQWLLKLWMGIYCEARSKFDDALALYSVANQICGQTQWQILWRIGEILRNRNMSREAYQMLHMCRILRPDTQTVLGDMIEELRQAGLRTTA